LCGSAGEENPDPDMARCKPWVKVPAEWDDIEGRYKYPNVEFDQEFNVNSSEFSAYVLTL
jgi:hypothetical protein